MWRPTLEQGEEKEVEVVNYARVHIREPFLLLSREEVKKNSQAHLCLCKKSILPLPAEKTIRFHM